jgi:two-component system nitrogen regulation response regulator GlnG
MHRNGASTETQLVPEIIGQAPAMQEVFRTIGRLSQSHATVLINGESGTGKELVARALHRHSPRRDAAFVAINMAAIPRDLIEAELFGHEKGAFTGATARSSGRFEQAEGGTLFLDEIGDMPAELQTRLLRVLSDGHFYRVGGQQPIRANVRVIAATHQDLEERVKQGLFREDLFHRLNVIRLRLPSIRERKEDIPILVRHFLHKSAQELQVEPKRISEAALRQLQSQSFPGNVRQLENLCHWLTVMAPGQVVDVSDLPPDLRVTPGLSASSDWTSGLGSEADRLIAGAPGDVFEQLSQEFERTVIQRALAITGGRRIEAAHLLGIGRNTITRKIQELGIEGGRSPAGGDPDH